MRPPNQRSFACRPRRANRRRLRLILAVLTSRYCSVYFLLDIFQHTRRNAAAAHCFWREDAATVVYYYNVLLYYAYRCHIDIDMGILLCM